MKIVEPRYYQEAIKVPHWREATALPLGKNPINYKGFYKMKYKLDGMIERFKSRLMVHGDHQLQLFNFH